MKFVENKRPDMAHVARLLARCEAENHWANFGPLYHQLADEYAQFMQLGDDTVLIPCANAGLGLELQARALAADAGVETLRWVGPALSFKNLGRGYFADMTVLDCDARGVLDVDHLSRLPADSYDGIVVINPFGMCRDFTALIDFARTSGKKLLIDNAAGLDRNIPDWPWQVFSLHQTKPFGVGEGGLVLAPKAHADAMRALMNYGEMPAMPAHWLNNAKISDIACAFQIARLQAIATWEGAYREQRTRIAALFASAGVCPLFDPSDAPLTTSLPMVMPGALNAARLDQPRHVPVSRQYAPLAPRPQADALYATLINYPTHPDMAQLSDAEISADIAQLLTCCEGCT